MKITVRAWVAASASKSNIRASASAIRVRRLFGPKFNVTIGYPQDSKSVNGVTLTDLDDRCKCDN